jgi:hypothetical protein
LPFTNDTTNDHFNTLLYTGNGSTQSINGLGFQPDLVWFKKRSASQSHALVDTVRGTTKWLESDVTQSEQTFANNNITINADGIDLDYNGGYNNINQNAATYAAWCWKAGGALFTDSSSSGHSISYAGVTHHSTTQNKIGGSSIRFNGSSDYLDIQDHDDWDFGTNDWTIEFWVRFDNTGNVEPIIDPVRSGNYRRIIISKNASDKLDVNIGTGSAWFINDSTASGTLSANTWYNVAVVRNGTSFKVYVDGTETSSNTNSGSISGDQLWSIGTNHQGGYGSGYYLDEFRVSNVARYTANFTPSTTAFTTDGNTKLLVHSDNAHNEFANTNGSITTFGHGLSSAPELIIFKNRDHATYGWCVYHASLGASAKVFLNLTSASTSPTGVFNTTAPTSSLVHIGAAGGWGETNGLSTQNSGVGHKYIAYCFHSVAGYSKIGSYTGNGSSTGPIITTGFKVAWLIVKRTDNGGGWEIWDNKRDNTNPIDAQLEANSSAAEVSGTGRGIDFLSDGFQIKNTTTNSNANGGTHIYMAFADTTAMGEATTDKSGQNNDWAPNNLNHWDQMVDTPTNNFATLNPLDALGNSNTFSDGNLKATISQQNTNEETRATFGQSTGKYYWEHYIVSSTSNGGYFRVGLKSDDADDYWLVRGSDGEIENNGSNGSSSVSYTTTDVVGVAVDLNNGKWWTSVNGTWVGSPTSGTGALHANLSGTLSPYVSNASSGGTHVAVLNFGQDATFAGSKSPSTVYNDGDYGSFYYQPPTGFKALCTQNLPDPAVKPGENFNALTYSGDGSTSNAITGAGFQPDFVWIKRRDSSSSHHLGDVVRGPTKSLLTNGTGAENTSPSGKDLISFDADGFTVGEDWWSSVNDVVGQSQISWLWKAGGTAVSNTSGSITSQVSANTAAGFSVIGWTGNNTAGATIGHGLSSAPEVIMVKGRSFVTSWRVYHTGLGSNTTTAFLNLAQAPNTGESHWNSTNPGSSVFTLGAGDGVNNLNEEHIAYCFHSVDGFSKIGSYTGNGSADGPFIYTGFQPKYILVKRVNSAGGWPLLDDERNPYNVVQKEVRAESSDAERDISGSFTTDFLSNGFKCRANNTHFNGSNEPYIYMAFAEFPFKFATAR